MQFNLGATPRAPVSGVVSSSTHLSKRQWVRFDIILTTIPVRVDAVDKGKGKGKFKSKDKDTLVQKGNGQMQAVQREGQRQDDGTVGTAGNLDTNKWIAPPQGAPAVHAATVVPSFQSDAQLYTAPQVSPSTITITSTAQHISRSPGTPPLSLTPQMTWRLMQNAGIFSNAPLLPIVGSDMRMTLLVDGGAITHVCPPVCPPWFAPETPINSLERNFRRRYLCTMSGQSLNLSWNQRYVSGIERPRTPRREFTFASQLQTCDARSFPSARPPHQQRGKRRNHQWRERLRSVHHHKRT